MSRDIKHDLHLYFSTFITGGYILSLRFGHEKKYTTNLALPLLKEGQLSVTGDIMGTEYL